MRTATLPAVQQSEPLLFVELLRTLAPGAGGVSTIALQGCGNGFAIRVVGRCMDDEWPGSVAAVVGGIGLLGIIVEATLQLKPIPSPFVKIDRIPAPDVDALLKSMARIEESHDAAVVWLDAYARGRRTGRSVIHAARWVERLDTDVDTPDPARLMVVS